HRRLRLLLLLHAGPLRLRLQDRPLRVHRGRARRHRQHRRCRARRLSDRLHRELQQRPDVACAPAGLDGVARLHPSDPDPRVQATGTARGATRDTIMTRTRSIRVAYAAGVVLLILYPWLYTNYLTNVLTQWLPDTSTAFIMVTFTVMAVGLNFVVGYCGLL